MLEAPPAHLARRQRIYIVPIALALIPHHQLLLNSMSISMHLQLLWKRIFLNLL